jgi:tRNA dimethylallyltransferase
VDGLAAVASKHRLIALAGPTASGKSALAMRIAGARPAEIVSCDSLQVYRGLDVGSAKPSAADRAAVPHHLIDVVDPDQDFSAADYGRLGRRAIADIGDRGRVPVVAGGTGLYLRALLHGLFEGPARDEPLRRRLEAIAERHGDPRLHRILARVDPESAARIEVRDRVRVVRALEVYRATGRPIGEHHRAGAGPLAGFEWRVLVLDPGRERLRPAVEARTDAMLAGGLIEETRRLLDRYPGARPLEAIGYRQAAAVVRGERPVEQARRDIVVETMRYAKRQRTWFRHQETATWFADAEQAFEAALRWLDGPTAPTGQ